MVTAETAWVPYYHGYLYAAYRAEDSREVVNCLILIAIIDQAFLKDVLVSVYPSRPGFLVDYPYTFNVFRLEVGDD